MMNMRRFVPIVTAVALAISIPQSPLATTSAHDMEGFPPIIRDFSAQETSALCDEIEARAKDIQTITVSFRQERNLAMFEKPLESRGRCVLQTPDKLRLETTEPYHSILIAQKRKVAKYEEIGGKWKKLNLGGAEVILKITDEIGNWMRGRFREHPDAYAISARQTPAFTITLTPKNEDFLKFISAIEITLDEKKERPVLLIVREPGGDFTRMEFSDYKVNEPIDAALFDASGAAPAALSRVNGGENHPDAKPAKLP
ncbi:hypothetical protein BH09SUM1_BH09SUM1_18610 [soil metagenome]